jgi:pyrroline-5-carboxylate reductase
MGAAMLAGWLAGGVVRHAWVVEPAGLSLPPDDRVGLVPDSASLPSGIAPDVLVLAVKPQAMEAVVGDYRAVVESGATILSIAAGKTVAAFEGWFGAAAAIVRAMPNLPASIGRGITVCVANAQVAEDRRALCGRLLEAVGEVEWVDDEGLLDAVTAVSGSGPAYVFLLIEALAAAGERSGLPGDLAMRLARATVAGAGELARRSSLAACDLRRGVTSPGGTTQAALDVLMAEPALQDLFDRAIAAATRRSKELAG